MFRRRPEPTTPRHMPVAPGRPPIAVPAPDAPVEVKTRHFRTSRPAPISSEEAATRATYAEILVDTFQEQFVGPDKGQITLKGVDPLQGVLSVELSGSCSDCALSGLTTERRLRMLVEDNLPWVQTIVTSVAAIDPAAPPIIGQGSWQPKEVAPGL